MKRHLLASAGILLLATGPVRALAQEDKYASDYERNQSAAVGSSMDSPDMRRDRGREPGESAYPQTLRETDEMKNRSEAKNKQSEETGGQAGMAAAEDKSDAASMEAKSKVGPHSIMVESALQNALTQIKGLRAQLATAPMPNQELMEHFKMHGQMINDDLKMAKIHQNELRTSIADFPKAGENEDFKSLDPAMKDVERLNRNLQANLGKPNYWAKKDLVKNDLDRFEKQLNNAIDKTRNFSSKELGLRTGIG